MGEEEIVLEQTASYKPAIFALAFIGTGVAGYFIYRKFFASSDDADDEEREVAYTYEQAVEKARARLVDSGKDDGVKLVKDDEKPELKDEASYHDILNDLKKDVDDEREVFTSSEKIESETVEEEKSIFVEITEETYKYGNAYNLKYTGSFDKDNCVLEEGWTESFDEVTTGPMIDELARICSKKSVNEVYLSNPEEGIDYAITVFYE